MTKWEFSEFCIFSQPFLWEFMEKLFVIFEARSSDDQFSGTTSVISFYCVIEPKLELITQVGEGERSYKKMGILPDLLDHHKNHLTKPKQNST